MFTAEDAQERRGFLLKDSATLNVLRGGKDGGESELFFAAQQVEEAL